MLYEPYTRAEGDEVSLVNRQLPGSLPSSSATWINTTISLIDAGGPIWDILDKFSGTKGPLPNPVSSSGLISELDTLHASNLSFYHLNRLGKIEIVLVESMCEHLELDTRAKTLKLFKCPSYCVLLSSAHRSNTFLDS
ncbi:hypothetical protein BDV96DRAFT_194995 [Lophiotrema nucula]|uniref:Uncharacterized protein n=1 Tax=Lophiotrema nucula TaxID=690887 RepID=A0A6A5YV01_9PLEO|nr:hypothetical protein BDV96DRAFT_194995 [Lophiotrema nucula]